MRCKDVFVAGILFFCIAGICRSESIQPGSWTQPVPGMPQLYRHSETCNTYLLKAGEKALLFDCGAGVTEETLKQAGVLQVDWVLITAHHRENVQGLPEIHFDGMRVAASAVERDILEHPTNFRKWDPKLSDKYTVYGASYARPPQKPIQVDLVLEDKSPFEWEGYQIECLSTPGHSPGGMTYLLRAEGKTVAIVGGLIHDGSKMATWYDSEWDYGFAVGLDTLLESVSKISEQKLDGMLPDQGACILNPAEQLEAFESRLVQFRAEYVRGYPVFDNDVAKRDPLSQPTAVKHLRQVTPHLYKLSHDFLGRNFAIIISDNGRGLVLDCGLFPKDILDEIILGMQEHLGLKRIDAFWISHMHGDHFLLGPRLKEKYGAQAWTMESVVDRCENPRAYDYAAMV
ncbi:MAG: MBL fold metallo-hydrolase, partial [Planctomycetaceae bacterium]|nr:MBL fold metallo-hydrolase [Planctomycetaceae bacterium]